ncbi:zinc ABC transporter substrate-binding protein [Gemmobacter straminiformis]|uniref:High-affinity zinc uptake system protein ZnuA n=1 Tax=Paragemmobacter straminiformis TaxID=2045119 RepID=A0A842I9F4_9RHOB|nr:zinc ABC transporter substrate-binding protein [Gemmobacter straminiformis]
MRYIISFLLTSLAATAPITAPATASAEVPRVVTDIPPVHALVAQVMGDLGSPALLLAKGASEHDFQLRPSQAQALAEAQLVVWIGPELTPWLDRALRGLTTGTSLALLDAPETETRAFSADGAHMEADHDGHDDHGHDGHDHSGTDPHAWLDPDNARHWLPLVAAELSRLDPANAATYAANAKAADARIAALDTRLAAQLAPYSDRPIVAYHDAYGYFSAHYGLKILGSIALGDATAPGAAKLSALTDALAAGQAACLFPEAQHDPALAEQLASGAGLRLGPALDPVGSTLEPGPAAYAALLTALADGMTTCLGAGSGP